MVILFKAHCDALFLATLMIEDEKSKQEIFWDFDQKNWQKF